MSMEKFNDIPALDIRGLEILDSHFHLPQNVPAAVLSREHILITENWPWREDVEINVVQARALYEWLGRALPQVAP